MDGVDSTQTQLQEQNPETLSILEELGHEAWGYLDPCNSAAGLTRIGLFEQHVAFGRNPGNKVVLSDPAISSLHAILTFHEDENSNYWVMVHDHSSNGTYINGTKIGLGSSDLLEDGNELAFGISRAQNTSYRYIYRDLTLAGQRRELLRHYRVRNEELGRGSFGVVHRAYHKATNGWVAVKMIANTTATVDREISIMKTLHHPNICQLLEVFRNEDGSIDLVIELVEGGDLYSKIAAHNGLRITHQFCQALAYMHGRGITHRDLKPENILLSSDFPPIVKVADFGLAKLVDHGTQLRTLCGTPEYIAPEIWNREDNLVYDHLVDSWSAGVIVFSMLTGCDPFKEDEDRMITRSRIPSRSVEWELLDGDEVENALQLSRHAKDFVRRLLEVDPRKRMSLTDALHHPWLTAVARSRAHMRNLSRKRFLDPDSRSPILIPRLWHLICGILVVARKRSGLDLRPGVRRLERRSDVLKRALETGIAIEPSQGMIDYVRWQDQELCWRQLRPRRAIGPLFSGPVGVRENGGAPS
ncbi:kinase-like domain-containing protein [Mycena sp. CBHHK59/15]|nr:kinase-like domain-containing protein [Mycena sp. CBHHK59/15]